MDRELVMYSRTIPCPYVTIAREVLDGHGVPYREIRIDEDAAARERVKMWTGFHSVPTLVVTKQGGDLPYTEPRHLEEGRSPKGVDRGPMITEPDALGLVHWLRRNGFLQA